MRKLKINVSGYTQEAVDMRNFLCTTDKDKQTGIYLALAKWLIAGNLEFGSLSNLDNTSILNFCNKINDFAPIDRDYLQKIILDLKRFYKDEPSKVEVVANTIPEGEPTILSILGYSLIFSAGFTTSVGKSLSEYNQTVMMCTEHFILEDGKGGTYGN